MEWCSREASAALRESMPSLQGGRSKFLHTQQNLCYNLRLRESEEAGEMDEWLKSHAWKACIGS